MKPPAARLNILAVEPFFGGSHRRFLESVVAHSRHHWTLLTGKPVHWKWRMRSAPLVLAQQTNQLLAAGLRPDLLFCTDMLDLPTYRGLLDTGVFQSRPTIIYFHENQWTYPVSPQARVDHHYGYTNLISSLLADAVVFNSQFHLQDFLAASERFLKRMPDSANEHDLAALRAKSQVIAPGFDPVSEPGTDPVIGLRSELGADPMQSLSDRASQERLTIGWAARWEHDKRPDRFAQLLEMLDTRGLPFELVLLGPRPKQEHPAHRAILRRFADRVVFDGYDHSADSYWQRLSTMDVIVSTADHEYFGIAVCEAIWAGAAPVLPNRLSYPELVPAGCLYEDLPEAVELIEHLLDAEQRDAVCRTCQLKMEPLQSIQSVQRLDQRIESLVGDREWA